MKKKKRNNEKSCNNFTNSIIESSPIPIIAVNTSGKVLLWNKAAEKTFGWKQSEIIGKPNPIIPKDRKEEFEELLTRSLKGEDVIDFNTVRKCKNGADIHVSISVSAWKDDEGNVIGGIAQMIDITNRILAEKSLFESEERYKNLFDSIRDAILVADTERNIISCNPAFTEIFGYSFEEIVGKKTLSVYENEEQFLELGKALKEHFGEEPFLYTVNYKRKDDSVFPGETGVFYMKDNENNVTGFIGLIRDISVRVKTETELKESEEKYREFFMKDLTGDFLSTIDGKMIDCNPAFLRLVGYESIEELKGHSLLSLYKNKNDRDELVELVKEKRELSNYETSLVRKSGEEIHVLENVVGVFDNNGNLTHLRGYIFDITGRKVAEERLQHVHSLLYAIRNVNQLIVTEKNIDTLMHRSCEILLESRGYSAIWIGLTDDLKSYNKLFSYGIGEEFNKFSEKLRAGKIPGCLTDLSLEQPFIKIESVEEYCKTCAMLPSRKGKGIIASLIKHLDNIYGVLYIITENIDLFTEEEESLIEEVSGDLGLAIFIQEESKKREEAEIRLQKVMNIIPEIFIIVGSDRKIKFINKAGLDGLRKTSREVSNQKPQDILPKPIADVVLPLEQKTFDTKKEQGIEALIEIGGDKRWFNLEYYPSFDEKGNVKEIVGAIKDITESKFYEQRYIQLAEGIASKVGEEFFDVLVENLSETLNADVVLIGKIDKNNQDMINTISVFQFHKHVKNFTYTLKGTPCENVVNKKLCSYEKDVTKIFPSDRILIDLEIEGYIGTPLWDSKGNAIGILVCLFKSPIENVKIKESIIHVFGLRAAAEIERLEQLSEILKQRNELEENEQRYRTLADNGQALIWTANLDKKCNYFNKVWLDFTERTLEQELGDGWTEGVHPDDLERCIDIYITAFDQRKPFSMVYRLRRYDGEYRWIQDDGTPRVDKDENFIGYIGHCLDVTERKNAEDALKESENKFRSYVENAFDGIYVMEETHYKYVNKRFCELTGYSERELTSLGFDYKLLLTDKSTTIVEERYEARKLGKSIPQTYETEIKRKDGTIKDVEISTVGIGEKADLKILGFMHDITEQKQTVKKIKESEKRFRSITQTANDAIVTAGSDGKIIGWNPSAERMFGYTEEEALYQSLSIIIPPKYLKKHLEGMQRVIRGGEHKVIAKTIELEGLPKNGKIFPIELSLAEWESAGEKFYTGIMRNIFERKRAEEEIKKLSRGVEQSPASIVITDSEGNIEYVNKKFTEITGYSFKEAIGKNPRILKSENNDPNTYKDLWTTIKAGKEWRGELCNKKKSGNLYWEMASISPLKINEGKVTHFIAVKEDITAQKKLVEELTEAKKKAESADKMKSEFLAQMSHEIRSPLNAVLSFTDIVKEETSEIESEVLEIAFPAIESSSKRIIRTVDMILNMSDIQTGTYTISKRLFNLTDLLRNLVKEYESSAQQKRLQLNFQSDVDNAEVEMDDYAVNQIFANLIDNSIKYTNEGFVEIRLMRTNSDKYIVELEDSGIGISEEYLPELFSPFSQEEHGYSRKFDGAGLGMSLVKKYCELINAGISVESKKNIGTKFIIVFS